MRLRLIAVTVAFVAVLTACSHSHDLLVDAEDAPLYGVFEHGQTTRLVIEINGKRYEAHGFHVKSQTNWAELSRRYKGSNPKRWDRIFAGHDKSQTFYSVDTTLKSTDGSEMACSLAWQSMKPHAGTCTEKGGREYPVKFSS